MIHRKRINKTAEQAVPSLEELGGELRRERFRRRYRRLLRSTIYALVVVAAVSVLIATLLLPVLEIYGTSMKPNLTEGDIVVSVKSPSFERGDVIAFYYNNRVLVKRVIAVGGESVDIDADGNVSVDGILQEETYLAEKDTGTSDLDYPYAVPAGAYFVMGDHRSSSVDSRNSLVGCVERSEIVGKIIFRVWPLKSFGRIR